MRKHGKYVARHRFRKGGGRGSLAADEDARGESSGCSRAEPAFPAMMRFSGNPSARHAFYRRIQLRRTSMDKEHVKGAADKAKGAIKDAAGKMTGDHELQAEGKMDKAKGAAHSAVGDAKDAVRKAAS
jgi:uncharacterized protein YjbJ (UPF0337 family)